MRTCSREPKVCYATRVPRTFLIDTDTASDDAVALIMALRAPEVRVAAITTVAGNVDVRQATRNALYTTELCASDAPVFMGAEKPLLREYQNATWFHGRDGLLLLIQARAPSGASIMWTWKHRAS